MKKIVLVAAVASALLASQAFAGKVTFQGQVTAQTCNMTINGNNIGSVALNPAKVADLAAAGSSAGETPFTIKLSGCTAPAAPMKFTTVLSGHSVTPEGNLGNVATASPAGAVAIQILEPGASKTAADLSGGGYKGKDHLTLAAGATEASAEYTARYYSAAGSATPGAVEAVMEYTFQH